MNEQNEEEIKRFMDIKTVNGQSPWTIRNQEVVLRQLDEYLQGKTFKEATEQDILGFVTTRKNKHGKEAKAGTKKNSKVVVKGFYRFLYGMRRGEYPEQVLNLNGSSNGKRELPIRPEDILNDEDIAKLVKSCTNFRDEAMIVTLFESGTRLGEFLNMNVGHINFDEKGIVLLVKGKTGERRVRLIRAVPYLTKWLQSHPLRSHPDAPLWCSVKSYNGENSRLTAESVQNILMQLGKRSAITKPMNPHAFRHSRISQLAKTLNDSKLRVFAGWTPGSSMSGIYVHLSGRDLDEDLLRDAGEETVQEKPMKSVLAEKECVRCHSKNAGVNEFCGTCGRPFDEDLLVSKEVADEAILKEELNNVRKDYDRLTRVMMKMVKEIQVLKKKTS